MIRKTITLAAALAALAVALPAAASASNNPTAGCTAAVRCVAVDVHGPAGTPDELALTATTLTRNAAVTVTAGPAAATAGPATQDWQYHQVATVPAASGDPGAYRFTGYDNANYGGDAVYTLEAAPNGVPSGFCLANIGRVAVLRHCSDSRWQAFINASQVGAFSVTDAFDSDGSFALSVLQAGVTGHHRGLKAVGNLAATQLQFRAVRSGLGNSNWDNEDVTG
jgi:hypothetical protein